MVIETYRIVKITCAPFNIGPAVKYYDLFANLPHLLEDPNSAQTQKVHHQTQIFGNIGSRERGPLKIIL